MPTYDQLIGFIKKAENQLREEGRLTPRVEETSSEYYEMCEELKKETKGMTKDQIAFKFEMEYKERIDNYFKKLYKISEEEGLIEKKDK